MIIVILTIVCTFVSVRVEFNISTEGLLALGRKNRKRLDFGRFR